MNRLARFAASRTTFRFRGVLLVALGVALAFPGAAGSPAAVDRNVDPQPQSVEGNLEAIPCCQQFNKRAPGTIAFVSSRDGNPEIYTVNPDGTNLTRLTNDPAVDEEPAWSPDGKRIAFVSNRSGNSELYVMNADGSNVVRRTFSGGFPENPAWSPDGTKIAYSAVTNGSANLWVVSSNAGGPGRTFRLNCRASRSVVLRSPRTPAAPRPSNAAGTA